MPHAIIGLVGPARAGKTTLIDRVIEELPHISRIKSLVTRSPRNEDDHLVYDFVSHDDFRTLDRRGLVLEKVEYAGNLYGIHKDHLEDVLFRGHGICALVEDGVDYFRKLGMYPLVTIRIVPVGYAPSSDPARQQADAARAARQISTDFTVENRFGAGGLDRAAAQIMAIIRGLEC